MSILNYTDGYKVDHRRQYPKGTELVYSNLTARKSRNPAIQKVVFFGLQYFIKKYLIQDFDREFFQRPKIEVVAAYKRRIENYLGKGAITYEHIEALHDLGYLPIQIKAVPEGLRVPCQVAMFTIRNTRPEFFWLTNFLETLVSCILWLPITSATTAFEYRSILESWAERTGGAKELVQWQAHDFSFRGMAGLEAAEMSGAAHLLSFTGTDTIPSIDFLERFYRADSDKELIGGSVPATEHSVMCMGTQDDEIETFRRLIEDIYPSGIVSIVSDTWDFWKVVTEYVPGLKDIILSRAGKVVIRPDSGDPIKIVCGDPAALAGSPEQKGAIECLWETFGGNITEKGFKALDSHIGLIYGDSISLERCQKICQGLADKGFASTNVVFGVGSYTYQYVTRDTYGMAIKATYGKVLGNPREIFKAPKTDDGTKKSAKGLLQVQAEKGSIISMRDSVSEAEEQQGALKEVFRDGKLIVDHSLAEIRALVSRELALKAG